LVVHPQFVLDDDQIPAALLTLYAGEQDGFSTRTVLRKLLTVRAIEVVKKAAETKV
jgi:hypothetical protein